ncbi:MAG: inositol monophosphatase family protein [Armatimonadota bacterium]|nr:inositol monophosphatase family protein [Armatimonadota bacterium]
MKLSDVAGFALDVAREASDLVMGILPEPWDVKLARLKGPGDLVTRADCEAERLITSRIRRRFADHGIVGEEGTEVPGRLRASGGPRWLVDPVDGTSNFAHGLPWFAISIAFEDRGDLQCGVVAVPPLAEYFVAERGNGAHLLGAGGPQRLAVSRTAHLTEAMVASGLPGLADRDRQVATFAPMMRRTLKVRLMGAAAIHLAYVAAGRLDGFWEASLKPWDIAAGVLLVEEAGGRVTDWAGEPLQLRDGDILATNGAVHAAMAEVLAIASEGSSR